MIRIKEMILAMSLLFSFTGIAQEALKTKAEKAYSRLAYIDAIQTYERIAEKGYASEEIYRKLADACYFTANYEASAKWYAKFFQLNKTPEAEYYYRYAQSLKSIGKYDRAAQVMEEFIKKKEHDTRARLANSQKDYLSVIKENSKKFKVSSTEVNTEYSDYGSAFFNGSLIFASARNAGGIIRRTHGWTGEGFTRLYCAGILPNGTLGKVKRFAKELSTRFHESTPVFTKDGKTVYFTRNNFQKGKKGTDPEGIMLLKIYRAQWVDGKWKNIEELPFTADDYSVAHPALSPDDTFLYFASNRPGSLGASDLYRVRIHEDGTYSTPENLGETINTEGRETYPFISGDNILYFASDGHPGLGGLDIFASKIKEDGSFTPPQNLGQPMNSKHDDFAFIIDVQNQSGFFSSNRPGGKGNDDIYRFKQLSPVVFECEQYLAGIVTDRVTGELLPGTEVTLRDAEYNVLATVYADSEGRYDLGSVTCGEKYYLRAVKEAYTVFESSLVIDSVSGKTEYPVALEKEKKEVAVGDDLAKILELQIIHFDLDRWNIRPDAEAELAKILDVMQEYPAMKIDIRSHTDSRASHAYNETLSEKRARSTMEWLIGKGIAPSRLSARGYGETQLVNHCEDGVECTEEQHQENRRSEFVITEL